MKYEIYNPNRFTVPIMIDDPDGNHQVNLLPRRSIVIEKDQLSENAKSLANPPRNMIRIKPIGS